jgi:hypothetical protein
VPGEHPRLYVDILAFVEMARDKRQYRFVQDTRWGQRVLVETDDVQAAIGAVTDYVALRLVEREKALASDGVRGELRARAPALPVRPPVEPAALEPAQPKPMPGRDGKALRAIAWFALGLVTGGLVILAVDFLLAHGLLAF